MVVNDTSTVKTLYRAGWDVGHDEFVGEIDKFFETFEAARDAASCIVTDRDKFITVIRVSLSTGLLVGLTRVSLNHDDTLEGNL